MVKTKKAITGINPYVAGKPIEQVKREYGLDEVIKLASNENPYGASKYAIDAAIKSLQDINLYPDGTTADLRAELSKKLSVDPDELLFGTGADEVISLISHSFIDAGDEMITADITFGQYKLSVEALDGNVITVPVKDYAYDLDGIIDAITKRTKIIYIANPNNPTGTMFNDEEKLAFINKVPNNILIVFDEAYAEYVEDESFTSSVPLVNQFDNLVVLNTFSKIYGLASLRIGYGVMNKYYKGMVDRIRKAFNVSIMAQAAALAGIKDDEFVRMSKANNTATKIYCYRMLDEMGLTYVKSHTNFILVDVLKDSMQIFEKLLKRGYIVRPVGLKTHLRITIGTKEQMVGFFNALKDVLN